MRVFTVEKMREMDKKAIESYGIKGEILMENAGNASFFAFFNETKGKGEKIAVIVGGGNNGGDGLVVARKFYSMGEMGYKVKVFLCADPSKFKGSALINYEIIRKIGIPSETIVNPDDFSREIKSFDIIIDAIFGTGLSREVTGKYKGIIEAINSSGKYVCSVDIPSGVNGNNGQVQGVAVRANCTVTFGGPKLGNVLYPGFDYCGKLFVTRISFPPEIYNSNDVLTMISIPPILPVRNEYGHKGTFGDALFIAGAKNYYGAPYYSALSFLKSGGGYSRLATPESVAPFVAGKGNEIVLIPLKETETGSISIENLDKVLTIGSGVDFIVIGPGLSLNNETGEFLKEFVKREEKPILIDGDGITLVSSDLESIRKRKSPTILTPHPGEMSRITGISINEIMGNRIEIIKQTAKDLGSIIVLKGAHSAIAYPDGRILINTSGNSAMATAGSGDVLTGVIAAMHGLGLKIEDSVSAGVFIHGLAGELASKDIGKDGVTAQSILDYLPLAVKLYRENYDDIIKNYHGKIFMI